MISVIVAGAGLWLTTGRGGADVASFGWLLVVLGAALLVVNVALRRSGFRMRRRRR